MNEIIVRALEREMGEALDEMARAVRRAEKRLDRSCDTLQSARDAITDISGAIAHYEAVEAELQKATDAKVAAFNAANNASSESQK